MPGGVESTGHTFDRCSNRLAARSRVTSGHVHVRVATRRNKDGTPVRYLQLTHNEWDPVTKTSRPKVLHSFGREDQLDRDAIGRLVASLSRLLDPASALAATGPAELVFTSPRPV